MTSFPERVFSGIQPTGNLHLGNYLGAIVKFVALQKTHECLFCVVDLHAITVPQDPKELRQAIRRIAAAYIASGVDPAKNIIFNQSQIAEHAELAWVFNCVARIGWLNRMTQFKEKAGKDRENASIGLFAYPALMAADILLYKATHVPVGEDQKQHIELARDIAQKFNNDFAESIAANGHEGGFFPLPAPLIQGPAARVMSLRDGTKKMSKSDPSEFSRINLSDDADAIAQKVRKAKTDPEPLAGGQGRPERASRGGKSGRHFRGPERFDARSRPSAIRRRAILGLQTGPDRPRGDATGSDRRGNAPARGRSRPISIPSCAKGRSARAPSPSRTWPRSRTLSASSAERGAEMSGLSLFWRKAYLTRGTISGLEPEDLGGMNVHSD